MTTSPILLEEPLTAARIARLDLARVADANTLTRGRRFYIGGRARVTQCDYQTATIQVQDTEPKPYRVRVSSAAAGHVTVDCTCPVFDPRRPCKHVIAALLILRDYLERYPPRTWDGVLERALRAGTAQQSAARKTSGAATTGRSILLFSIQQKRIGSAVTDAYYGLHLYSFAAKSMPTELIEASNAYGIAQYITENALGDQATAVRTLKPERFVGLSPNGLRAAEITSLMQQNHWTFYSGYQSRGNVERVLPMLYDSPVFLGDEAEPFKRAVRVIPDDEAAGLKPCLNVTDEEGGLRLEPAILHTPPDGGEAIQVLDREHDQLLFQDPVWLLRGHALLRLGDVSPAFLTFATEKPVVIPASAKAAFYQQYLVPLAEQIALRGDGISWEETPETTPVRRLYLGEKDGALRAELRFAYGPLEEGGPPLEMNFDPAFPERTVIPRSGGEGLVSVRRDPVTEKEAQDALASGYTLKRSDEPGCFTLRARATPVDFLLHQAPQLTQDGFEIYGDQTLASVRVNRNRPTLSFGVSSGIDWFDVEAVVRFGDVEASLIDVKNAIRKRERYIKLADGSVGEIPQEWVDRYRYLFALGEAGEKGVRLSSHHALLLDQLLADAEGQDAASVQIDAEFTRRRDLLRAFDGIAPKPLPSGLNITLYPYQKAGYDWLQFLHEYNFGGCLADDMGLGKTAQTLVHLLSLRKAAGNDHAQAPDLIVAPRSLLFNWERESKRFTPDLKVLVYADSDRPRDIDALREYDLIVTTYGILLRDIEMLRGIRFHYAVLDEAQMVKNPMAQTSRAARLLNADHRLALTGTPVENSTVELWSLFAFLNPGLLGNLERFKEEFSGAIERHQDESASETLRRLIRPFLLRRTKEQVAKDLPSRTERLIITDMEPAQKKLYNKLRDQYRAQVLGLLDEPGAHQGRAQIKVLEGLLRLRQVCNHPKLVEPTFRGDSAKFIALLETMETLQAEGHKALIFSQFVQALTLLREILDERKIPYVYLDGRTRDRQARVDQFQNDPETPFFLISLKAGGTGLNLTAADYVIHVDPWWNPAVEQQATDRAHRIGQTRPVFVYKFLTRETVEEKILQLQERKRALVEQLVTAESSGVKSLTRADIEHLFS